jgi:hypothetical protein
MPLVCAASRASAIWMPRSSTVSVSSDMPTIRCPERLPFQQFHGDERSSISLIDFVDRADVWVVQRGRSLGFPLEAAEGLCVVGKFVRKELQGDVATKPEVFCIVHNAHATAPDPAEDAVMGNCLPHGLGGRRHWLDMLGVD